MIRQGLGCFKLNSILKISSRAPIFLFPLPAHRFPSAGMHPVFLYALAHQDGIRVPFGKLFDSFFGIDGVAPSYRGLPSPSKKEAGVDFGLRGGIIVG